MNNDDFFLRWLKDVFLKYKIVKRTTFTILLAAVIFLYGIPIYWTTNINEKKRTEKGDIIEYTDSIKTYFEQGTSSWLFIQSAATIIAIMAIVITLKRHREILYLENYPSIIPITIQRSVARKIFGSMRNRGKYIKETGTHVFQLKEIIRKKTLWHMLVFDLYPLREQVEYPFLVIQNKGKGIATDVKMTICFPSHDDREEVYDFNNRSKIIKEDRVYSLEQNEVYLFFRDNKLYNNKFRDHFDSFKAESHGKFSILLEYKSTIKQVDIVEIFEVNWRIDELKKSEKDENGEDRKEAYYIDDFLMIPQDKWRMNIKTKWVIDKLEKNPKFIKK